MTVNLLHSTPLFYVAHGMRMSHNNHDKSDTVNIKECGDCGSRNVNSITMMCNDCNSDRIDTIKPIGPKDLALIDRVGNKLKHASTLEPLQYIFDIDGISRACLQEIARHRHASLTVESTRYTLHRLRAEQPFTEYTDFNNQEYLQDGYERACKYLVMTENEHVNRYSILALDNLRDLLVAGISNDIAKYALPEAYKVRLQWTINMRSLQNFLALRLDRSALAEIQELSCIIVSALPKEHLFLVRDIVLKAANGNPNITKLIPLFNS